MRIEVLTLFPEMFQALSCGIIGKAQEKGLLSITLSDIRLFSEDKHKKCDDYPFGGGAGMVMTPQPLHAAIKAVDPKHNLRRIYLSPKGKTLSQEIVEEYSSLGKTVLKMAENEVVLQEKSAVDEKAKFDGLMFVCGSYEGIDQRVIDLDIDEELSIGDYVLTGGELAAMVVINAVARYIDGVLGSCEATNEESFSNGLLEYPHYTRPQVFEGLEVPEVLLSGHHAEVEKWRTQKSLEITKQRRPDLIKKFHNQKN